MALWALAGGARAADAPAETPLEQRIAQCAALADDGDRLKCYDSQARPRAAATAIALVPVRTPDVAASPRPSRPRPAWRADVGYGWSVGDYIGTIALAHHGTLNVNSETGGAGGGLLGEVWLDDWPARDFSVGLEYLRIDNEGALDAYLPAGLAILTDPVYAHLGVRAVADVGMINIAYRPHVSGWLRPMVGVGIGGGTGYAAEYDVLANPFLGQAMDSSRSSSPLPLIQVLAGLDAELPGDVYLSLSGRLMEINAHPIGQNQAYTNLVIGTAIGYRFK